MSRIFDRPEWLALVFALVPAFAFFRFRLKRLSSALARLAGVDSTVFTRPLVRRSLFFAGAWVCLSVALSGPRIGTRLVTVRQEGASVMFVVDISRSMTVTDVLPDRLAFASQYASLLSSRLGTNPCGVTLAKGSGTLAIPLTQDRQTVRDLLDSLSPSMLTSPGSGLASALRVAAESFPSSDAAARLVVVLTDGDETSGSLADAAREAGSRGITVAFIGIGTPQGALIDADPDPDPKAVDLRTTVLREDTLRAAAEEAGGNSFYVNGSETGSAIRVLDLVNSSGAGTAVLRYSPEPVSRYPEFAFAAICLLGIGLATGGLAWLKKGFL